MRGIRDQPDKSPTDHGGDKEQRPGKKARHVPLETVRPAMGEPRQNHVQKEKVPWIKTWYANKTVRKVRVLNDGHQHHRSAEADEPVPPRVKGKDRDERKQ